MNVLFLTAHDYRTPRKVSLHFIADKLAQTGPVRFFSMRYSWLSRHRPDGRHVIADKANRLETVNGVDCFLWKPPLHPVNTRRRWLRWLEPWLYRLYVACCPALLNRWIREADVIFFESGIAPAFYDKAQRLNPAARKVYVAADELDAIDVAECIKTILYRISPQLDYVVVNSRDMVRDFAPGTRRFFVPHGIDESIREQGDPSPYDAGIHAVSVGSMLFDRQFVTLAAQAHPEMTFHIIGCGQARAPEWPANVRHYDEMPFQETIRYVKHAQIGLAPYRPEAIPPSLADTSMKLQQYAFFGVPAVCPLQVTGDYPHRFGYRAGDAASIKQALTQAVAAGNNVGISVLNWQQITDRYLAPQAYADTQLPSTSVRPAATHAYFFIETQFDNLGDALLNRELIRLMDEHASVTLGMSKVPASFESMLGNEFVRQFQIDRQHGRAAFLLKILWRRLGGERSYLFLSPGGWIGELDGRLNLRSWLHTALYYLLSLSGVRICQFGVSYEDLGPKLQLQLRSRSAAMFRHFVRDTHSRQTMESLSVKIHGLTPDLAFNAFEERESSPRYRAITFSFRDDQYPQQRQDIQTLVEKCLAFFPDTLPIFCVYQVKKDRAVNEFLASWLREQHGRSVQVDDGSNTIAATQQLYSRSDVMISNRLHSLLLAGSVGNTMLAAPITEHNKKIIALFDDLALKSNVLSRERLAELEPAQLVNFLQASASSCWQQKAILRQQFTDVFNAV